MSRAAVFVLVALSCALIAPGQRSESTEAYLSLIVRYLWGEHDAVTRELANVAA